MKIEQRKIVTIVLLVAALVSSYFVGSATSLDTTIVSTYYVPQTYEGRDNLYHIETITSTPVYANYEFSSNATLTVYIQTKSQFNNVDDLDEHPEEYLASYTGEEGSVSCQIEDPTKVHIITVYCEERFTIIESNLEAHYTTEVKASSIMLTLTQIAILFALGTVAYDILIENKED